MDLSKIPEPSEEDVEYVFGCLAEYDLQLELGCIESPATARVIAHLLRHGRELAQSLKELVYSATTPEGQAAISFFEKFGGDP